MQNATSCYHVNVSMDMFKKTLYVMYYVHETQYSRLINKEL